MASPKNQTASVPIREFGEGVSLWVYAVIIVVALAAFLSPAIQNGFTNWDDPGYVTANPLIHSLNGSALGRIFTTPVMGNYHPLTILSYAIEYAFLGDSPRLYHIDNLLLHLGVTLLVFFLLVQLGGNRAAACVGALIFGLHPAHVETVAWVSDRKDLLCGLFFFAASVVYVRNVKAAGNLRGGAWVIVLTLFVLALLSKSQAVVFPAVLLLFDYLLGRAFMGKVWMEKLPFVVLALVFAGVAFATQQGVGAVKVPSVHFAFWERPVWASYGIIQYLLKFVFPTHLSAFYPYPSRQVAGLLWVFPLLVVIGFALLVRFRKSSRAVVFGFSFFLIALLPVLQLVPVGDAVMADRYTYMAYFGLASIATWLLTMVVVRASVATRRIAFLATAVAAFAAGIASAHQCSVWYDSVALWRDVLESAPETPLALNNLGALYFDRYNAADGGADAGTYRDSARQLLSAAIEADPDYESPYATLGLLAAADGRLQEAKRCLFRVLALNHTPDEACQAGVVLGSVYLAQGKSDSAGLYLRLAGSINPAFPGYHLGMGKYLSAVGKPDSAVVQLGLAIAQAPGNYEGYFMRGETYSDLKQFKKALADFDKAAELAPMHGEIFYDRSVCRYRMGDLQGACTEVQKAIDLGLKGIDTNYISTLNRAVANHLMAKHGLW